MRRRPPDRERTPLDVLDRVLDKGIVIETDRGRTEPHGADSTGRIAVFGVDARVEIVTDLGESWKDASTR
jgi:hypothetical protein